MFIIECNIVNGKEKCYIKGPIGNIPSIEQAHLLIEYLLSIIAMGKKNVDDLNQRIFDSFEENFKNRPKEPNTQKDGWIYLIKSINLYKIGRAQNIKDRVKTYTTENPHGIKLILKQKVEDYMRVEKVLLDVFKNKKVRGEWHDFNKNDLLKFFTFLQNYEI